MASCFRTGTGRAGKFLLVPTILCLVCTGWILNSVGVEGAPVIGIGRDENRARIGIGNTIDDDKHLGRDKIETDEAGAGLGPAAAATLISPRGIPHGSPPELILPDYILQTDNRRRSANNDDDDADMDTANDNGSNKHTDIVELRRNQTVTTDEVTVPEIEYEPGLVLRCAGKGWPKPNMSWELEDGHHLPHYVEKIGLKYPDVEEEERKGENWIDLKLPKLNNAFYGRLRCRAENQFGNATWEVELIHNANSSVFMKIVRVILATVFVLVSVILLKLILWVDTRRKEKLYEKLPPQDLEIINKFKKGLAPPPPSPSSSICQEKSLGCVGGIEITVTGEGGDAALLKEGYRPVREQSSTPDLPKRLIGGGSGAATPTSCKSVHVIDQVNSWTNYVPYDDRLETSSQHFRVDFAKILEDGSYGMVFAGRVRNDLTMKWSTVAVKSGKSERDDNFLLESLLTELKILASLPKAHENIVNLKGAYTKMLHKRQAFIFLDFCENGNLANFLDLNRQYFQGPGSSCSSSQVLRVPSNNNSVSAMNSEDNDNGLVMNAKAGQSSSTSIPDKRDAVAFSMKELVAWSWQISDGMNFLHKNRILHGNLSTASVYLTAGLTAKIGNVGCPSREESEKCIDETTRKWLTVPNFGYEHFSKKSEAWDYGRVLWEIFSLRGQPFPGREVIGEFLRGEEGHHHEGDGEEGGIEIPDYATPEIFELMLCCWNEDGTLCPEFDFLSRALKQLAREMFPPTAQAKGEPTPTTSKQSSSDNVANL